MRLLSRPALRFAGGMEVPRGARGLMNGVRVGSGRGRFFSLVVYVVLRNATARARLQGYFSVLREANEALCASESGKCALKESEKISVTNSIEPRADTALVNIQ